MEMVKRSIRSKKTLSQIASTPREVGRSHLGEPPQLGTWLNAGWLTS
jgi:hypothetical protein